MLLWIRYDRIGVRTTRKDVTRETWFDKYTHAYKKGHESRVPRCVPRFLSPLSLLAMQALTACAHARSGVTRAESLALDKANLYERLGQDTIEEISKEFYTRY